MMRILWTASSKFVASKADQWSQEVKFKRTSEIRESEKHMYVVHRQVPTPYASNFCWAHAHLCLRPRILWFICPSSIDYLSASASLSGQSRGSRTSPHDSSSAQVPGCLDEICEIRVERYCPQAEVGDHRAMNHAQLCFAYHFGVPSIVVCSGMFTKHGSSSECIAM